MFINLNSVIEQVGKDKGIPKEALVEAVESAMLTAARKKYGIEIELEAQYNEELGEIELFLFKTVVEDVFDEDIEISLAEAKKLDPETSVGDSLGEKIDSNQFGRIAAQTAKQVIIQRVREAERSMIYEEYKDRVGELINGIVRRIEKGNLIVDLGRTEAILPQKEQVLTENFKVNDRITAYLLDLKKDSKAQQVVLSRKSPGLIKALFALEVPEIAEGIVEIKAVAREAGARSKIAVYSTDSDVDPVGACVGMKGARVQGVVQELRGEKIDIVPFDEETARFVCNAIAPAEVSKVIIHDKEHGMEIIVPDDQLSLAIGKKGQNVRLAAQLTGWNIDVLSETKMEEIQKRGKMALVEALGIEESLASILYSHTYRTVEDIARTSAEEFIGLPGFSNELLTQVHERAVAFCEAENQPSSGEEEFEEEGTDEV
ncbi:MAG: transcription termination/antitermination protein NusA [Deltaproteobacteria bacterium]|nr:transcription termination/antitermination protein NusA [Deltaproteobacteria bacterium]